MAKKKEESVQAEKTTQLEPVAKAGLPEVTPENWGASDERISMKEILIPKLLHMQGQSVLVSDEKAKPGDIANSVTGQVFTKPCEIIPFLKLPSTWVVNDIKLVDGQVEKEFREIYDVTPENEDQDWEVKNEQGIVIESRDYTMNFMVLVVEDIDAFPYVLSFRRTSLRAGKKLANHFQLCAKDRVAPARYVLRMNNKKEMNEKKQPYYVADFDVEKRKTNDVEFKAAYDWFQTFKIQKKAFKVDDTDERSGEREKPAPTTAINENAQY